MAVYKCPFCGETIDSFTAKCPSCGSEIRETREVTAVKEFSDQLK